MKRIWLLPLTAVIGMLLSACATVQLGSIPRPVETAKLRVALLPISGTVSRGKWGKSTEEYADAMYRVTRKQLDKLGYYEVAPESEMKAVLGGYVPERWDLTRNDAEFARKIGAALYADYVLLTERGTLGDPHYYFEVALINIESGRRFGVRINNTRARGEKKKLPDDTGKMALRELFRDARGDLLATALRKTGVASSPEAGQTRKQEDADRLKHGENKAPQQRHRVEAESLEKSRQERAAAETAARERAEADRRMKAAQAEAKQQADEAERVRSARQEEQERQERLERDRLASIRADEQKLAAAGIVATVSREVEYHDAEQQQERQLQGAKRLIVYDLAAATDNYRPVALILSEALREEIQKHGVYNLVNRENIQQLLNEMKFQQSGLVDNAQTVTLGKGAGAQEIVTGNLGALGRTVLLQSKRTDIQTMLNLSMASLKSEAGQEEQLLAKLADMVEQLLQHKR